jgi:SAM-dependent methyltransferase
LRVALIEEAATSPAFGSWAALYQRYRPVYPASVFAALCASLPDERRLCIELGAGSGQATLNLLGLFDHVIAVEPDREMAAAIPPNPRLTVATEAAELFVADLGVADAVVAATAFHWMQMDVVAANAAAWLRPKGVFFAFSYGAAQYPEAPAIVQAVFRRHLQAWRPHVDPRLSGWRPYVEPLRESGRYDDVGSFETYVVHDWSAEEAAGFLMTTSYGQAFARATGDAGAHQAALAAEIAQATKGRRVRVRFPIEGAYGRTRPAAPAKSS